MKYLLTALVLISALNAEEPQKFTIIINNTTVIENVQESQPRDIFSEIFYTGKSDHNDLGVDTFLRQSLILEMIDKQKRSK